MDALILLREAEDAGLSVEVQGDKLIVQGPRAAEPIVHRLAEHKRLILRALQPDWASDARKVIAQFDDPDLRSDLLSHYEETAAQLEHDQGNGRAKAEMLAFGELLAEILRRGIDVKTATR